MKIEFKIIETDYEDEALLLTDDVRAWLDNALHVAREKFALIANTMTKEIDLSLDEQKPGLTSLKAAFEQQTNECDELLERLS